MFIVPCTFFTDFMSDAMSIGGRKCKFIQYFTNSVSMFAWHMYCACFYHTCSTIHVFHAVPYMFYHTCFQRLQIGIGILRGSNYPLAVLCQDLGLFTLLAAVL